MKSLNEMKFQNKKFPFPIVINFNFNFSCLIEIRTNCPENINLSFYIFRLYPVINYGSNYYDSSLSYKIFKNNLMLWNYKLIENIEFSLNCIRQKRIAWSKISFYGFCLIQTDSNLKHGFGFLSF
ncbi:hypothetical protein BpHYR1_003634 [Brachionus plicatilis]|uniref:Uncharacterized protein n=1 Tax=Brachionus plicatilis TaxID=10195 RepID=A0A3M7PE44_BRAPC|nr:hypothetical protein BpHYR1_003634 [Brachionus plicatilis]